MKPSNKSRIVSFAVLAGLGYAAYCLLRKEKVVVETVVVEPIKKVIDVVSDSADIVEKKVVEPIKKIGRKITTGKIFTWSW